MQSTALRYVAATNDQAVIADWQRQPNCVTCSAYTHGINPATSAPRSEKDLRDLLKERFPDHPLGFWTIHCAARDGLQRRRMQPVGKMVFGGRYQSKRRMKGLITRDEWRRRRRSRAISIVGDRTRWGNRHLRLDQDGLSATVELLGCSVTLHLPDMAGKNGKLVRDVAQLAAACEIGVFFDLGTERLSITLDPMDLRTLPLGETLESMKIAEQGIRRRGRPRKDASTHYAAHRVKSVPHDQRPVHPEWRQTIPTITTRGRRRP